MGRNHSKVSGLIGASAGGKFIFLLLLLIFLFPALPLSGQQGTGAHAAIRGFALPEYRKKDNRLQFILYGEKAVNLGALIELDGLTLDIVRDNVKHINSVIPLNSVSFYPIPAQDKLVEEFWRNKKHCHALIRTSRAQYDKNAKIIRGDGPIHFRSRQLDIEGVGFDAFYKTKLIHIRSKVKLVIRPFRQEEPKAKNTLKDGRNKK